MTVKPISALLIVGLGQINFALHNHHLGVEKSGFYQKFFEKNHDLKEHKDAKKSDSVSVKKQLSARFKNVGGVNLKKILALRNYQQDNQNLPPRTDLVVKFLSQADFDFSRSDKLNFGCCASAW